MVDLTWIRRSLAACALVAPLACASGEELPNASGGDGGNGSSGTTTVSSTSTGAGGMGGSPGPCVVAADCIAQSDACNVGACINGACVQVPANELAVCDDGKSCTLNDACDGGLCTGSLKFCTASDSCHVATCDVVTDTCVEAPGNQGASCIDDDPCTLTGLCSDGVCAPGQQVDCSFLDGFCSVGVCDSQIGCVAMPQNDGTPCDDGLYCTITDACSSGICSGVPNTCAPPGDICLIGTCDENTNSCVAVPGNNGLACNDGSTCTAGEQCQNGACGMGAPANQGVACADADACTVNETCQNGACVGPLIAACQNGDGCCPAGCNDVTDNDCTDNVLVIGAAPDPGYLADVVAKQVATGAFTSVDLFNAGVGTPTLATLAPYTVVLVFSDTGFQDPVGLGNVVADYYDGGGRVVLAAFAVTGGINIQGRFGDPAMGYMLLNVVSQEQPSDGLGVVFEPMSPLMQGVSSFFCASAYRTPGGAVPSATVVAAWGTGAPLIVRGVVQGRNRVDLNMYPPSDDASPGAGFWIGDGATMIKNALLFK